MNTNTYDLIIVGAGILGLSAAIQARQQGLKVCVFEKDAEPVGATRRNFGMVGTSTLAKPDTQWHEYALKTLEFYQNIQAETDISFQQRQGLYIANTELEWKVLQEFAERIEPHHIAVELLSRTQFQQQFDYLRPNELQGGLIVKEDYSVEPHLVAKRLWAYAAQLGVSLYANACVIKTQNQHNICQAILANGQQFYSQKILICHGDAVDLLYPKHLQQLGLKRCALQMALTQAMPQNLNASIYSGLSISRYPAFELCLSHAQLIEQSQQGLVKEFGIHILIKQNEFGELIIGDSHEYHAVDEVPQFEQREEINQFIQTYCHEKTGIDLPDIQKRWTGFYLSHDSELACVTEAEPNIYLVSAIAGKGMTTGAGFMHEVLSQKIF